MTVILKTINVLLIASLTVFVGVVSAIFFIGSDETYARLLEAVPSSFARRFAGGVCVGLFGAIIIVLLNYLILRVFSNKTQIRLTRLFWITLLLASIASLAGTIIFLVIEEFRLTSVLQYCG